MLALLSGASPKFCTKGPKVRLKPGKWRIEFDNVVSSTFVITLNTTPFVRPDEDVVEFKRINHGDELNLETFAIAQINFENRGSEHFCTILAKPVTGE
jgi:hypothetical protein